MEIDGDGIDAEFNERIDVPHRLSTESKVCPNDDHFSAQCLDQAACEFLRLHREESRRGTQQQHEIQTGIGE
jgi:hypothetical protein